MLQPMKSPLVNAVVQAVAISTAANVVAQCITQVRQGKPLSVKAGEGIRFSSVTMIITPLNYLWQDFLERTFPGPRLGTSTIISNGGGDGDTRQNARNGHTFAESAGHGNFRAHSRGRVSIEDEDEDEDEDAVQLSELLQDGSLQEHETIEFTRAAGGAGRLRLRFTDALTKQFVGTHLPNTLKKLLVDCFLVGIWWNVVLFLTLMGLFEAKAPLEIFESVKKQTVPIVLDSLKVWPFAVLFALTVVQVERRIIFYSAIGFFWAVYLSLVTTPD